MQLKPDAPQLTWQGAVSLHKTEAWVMPWRTPHPMHVLFPKPLLERSAMPAGVRISFRRQYDTGFRQYRPTERKRDAGSLL